MSGRREWSAMVEITSSGGCGAAGEHAHPFGGTHEGGHAKRCVMLRRDDRLSDAAAPPVLVVRHHAPPCRGRRVVARRVRRDLPGEGCCDRAESVELTGL